MNIKDDQLGLKIRRSRTTLVYVMVGLLILSFSIIAAANWLTSQTEALMPAESSGQVKVNQANYRLYQSSGNITPGAPLAADNTMATLSQAGASFRLRVEVENRSRALTQVSTSGWNHTCSVDSDMKAHCWGEGVNGALGNGSTNNKYTPAEIDMSGALAGKTIKQVSVGDWNTCAIASDDKVYCWGYGVSFGDLGNGTFSKSNVPVAVSTSGVLAGKKIKQVSVGFENVCAIDSDGKAYCWGNGAFGALGNGSTVRSNVPVAVLPPQGMTPLLGGQFKQISAEGGNRTCAIAYGDDAYCWGEGRYGGLGNNSTANSKRPVPVLMSGILANKRIKQISSGVYRTCVIASDNQIYCWGRNSHGQFGNNDTADSLIPKAASNGGSAILANAMSSWPE